MGIVSLYFLIFPRVLLIMNEEGIRTISYYNKQLIPWNNIEKLEVDRSNEIYIRLKQENISQKKRHKIQEYLKQKFKRNYSPRKEEISIPFSELAIRNMEEFKREFQLIKKKYTTNNNHDSTMD